MKKAFAASPILRACPVDPKDRTGVPRVVRFALCALRSAPCAPRMRQIP